MSLPNKCRLCDSSNIHPYAVIEARRYARGEHFSIYRCENCAVCFTHFPDGLNVGRYYPDSYAPHLARERHPAREFLLRRLRRLIFAADVTSSVLGRLAALYDLLSYRSIPYGSEPGRLLDVGCGSGDYLVVLRDLGWRVQGVEPNEHAVRIARQDHGLDVVCGDFETADLQPTSLFDVITMWHSLEHLARPREALLKAHQLLSDDGTLVIGVPNFDSFDRKLFQKSWNGLEIPLHLFHFTPRSIEQLLKRSGFRCDRIIHTIRPSDVQTSLQNLAEDNLCAVSGGRFSRASLFGIAASAALITSVIRRASIIKVYARKNPCA